MAKLAIAGLIALGPLRARAQDPVAPGATPISSAPATPALVEPPPSYAAVAPDPGHHVYGASNHALFGDDRYRSPGLAVALSLQPLPIDFGNLYAENLSWGVAYTAIEVSLMAPMMWVAGQHMGHGTSGDRDWSGAERGAMVGLVSGYVAVKLVAGLHAGYGARAFNRRYEPRTTAFVTPSPGGALLSWSTGF